MTLPWPPYGGNDDFNWDLDVTYDFESYVDVDFDTEVTYDSELDVEADICVDVDIDGNLAAFNIDVQAVGDDGATEVNLAVVTTDEYSSIAVTGYSAVD
ncbi:hypothetical protein [Microvirga roseola]|uniref:hypothetical protein n=1 Tax=Microvirga roseola TaxID=2883126 RepID=UPI001E2C69DC|nr:hypothetical protein [Microvirga roseola]